MALRLEKRYKAVFQENWQKFLYHKIIVMSFLDKLW